MRKRAQLRSKPTIEQPKHIAQQFKPKSEEKHVRIKKSWWIAIILVGIFLITLLFNTYFNLSSGAPINADVEGIERYYLSGPDPYYNMRLVEVTSQTGSYPYYTEPDPLLSYPLGVSGGRAPLFNMMALGFSSFLTPFMSEADAIGYSMQFIPALFGAILVFVVYFIGKELFNKKAGLIAAMFIAIIPIHLGSGHGSAYTLFDHDSFNLLLFFLTFLFLIKGIREKNPTKSLLYAVLGGIPLAGLTMTWVEAQYLYVVIAVYAVVQIFFDIFMDKKDITVLRTTSVVLFTGYFVSLPVIASRGGISFNTTLFLCLAVAAFGAVSYILGRRKIPWTFSMPAIFSVAFVGLAFLYFINPISQTFEFLSPLKRLSEVIFGSGIYGNKVSITIAEANTYEISHTVMSFGPALYWLAWFGFVLLMYYYYKKQQRRDYLFILVLFIINIWLSSTAGRFLNDMVPLIAILGGWIIWVFIDWIDYKQMIRNIRSAGGGLHGIRRGIKFLHIFGILFIAFLVLLPNVFVAFDAAIPNVAKEKEDGNWTSLKAYMHGDDSYKGAYGLQIYKERYWAHAFDWLSQQDTEIEDPARRPAFISWWDYGFYEVALGDHPTVADNFQDGIPTAANFHTATSEQEGVVVLCIRLIEGNVHHNGELTDDVRDILVRYLGNKSAASIENWMENPKNAPSYGNPIGEEYDNETSQDYTVGVQYSRNGVYHDIVKLLLTNDTVDPDTNLVGNDLSDEELTWLYHELQEATGYSIRYYGVEGYDRQIFNIFGFLADKSILLINGIEDDFKEWRYQGYKVDPQTREEIPNSDFDKSASEIISMSLEEQRSTIITNREEVLKDPYFESMFYKTYIGPFDINDKGDKEEFSYQVPCHEMKHFYAEYMSDPLVHPYQETRKGAVVIAKYYEGAFVNGTVTFLGESIDDAQAVIQKDLVYYGDVAFPIDHDSAEVNETGVFNVIAGAGEIILQIRRYPNLGQNAFIYKEIIFNDTTGPEYSVIADDDAMRKAGSNFERILNISVEPAIVEGYVYEDIDNDGSYNKSVDLPLSDYHITVNGVDSIEIVSTTDPITRQETTSLRPTYFDEDMRREIDTNDAGFYNFSDLKPGYYVKETTIDEIPIERSLLQFPSGNTSVNVSKPKLSNLEGIIYEDINEDGQFVSAEDRRISGAEIGLYYIELSSEGDELGEKLVEETVTDANGKYEFTSLIPSVIKDINNIYKLKITKVKPEVSEYPYYETESTVSIVANSTVSQNVSVELAKVDISGVTKYAGQPVEQVSIDFEPDGSVDPNTASGLTTTASLDAGEYTATILPGSYNVTVAHKEGETLIYSYNEKLTLTPGLGIFTYDIDLTKESVNVSGKTTYQGTNVKNVTITFDADTTENNTAHGRVTKSNENAEYSIELAPGDYKIIAESELFLENGVNYTYQWLGTITLEPPDATTGITLDIDQLDKIARPED